MKAETTGQPRYCDARRTKVNARCKLRAGLGTDHVGFGRCKFHGGASPDGKKFAVRQQAAAESARLGQPVDGDPHDALRLCVADMLGQRRWLLEKLNALEDGEGVEKGELHPLLRVFNETIDRLSRISKLAVDAGVEERRQQLDELVVGRFAGVIQAALAELDLTAEQRELARVAFPRHLATLDDLSPRPALAA